MKKILIVEDDTYINDILQEALTEEGYDCICAYSGTEASMLLERDDYAVVLLDLMLPGMSGERVLSQIRRKSNVPVIVLTAKDGLDEKIDVLTSGADDYITKPFEIKEVMARIQVQLRRTGQLVVGEEEKDGVLVYKDLSLDRGHFCVCVGESELPRITKQEFAILELLMKHPTQVFTKEDIFEYAWEEAYMGETKTLDVHISNIRKKIKKVSPKEYIETVWGIGYRLHP